MIALSNVQSSAQVFIHNASFSLTPPTMFDTIKLIGFFGKSYLSIIDSNIVMLSKSLRTNIKRLLKKVRFYSTCQ